MSMAAENGKVELDNEVILPVFEFIVDGDIKEINTKDNLELDGIVLDFDLEQQIDCDPKRQIKEIGIQVSHNLHCGLENNKEGYSSHSIHLHPRSLQFFIDNGPFHDLLFLWKKRKKLGVANVFCGKLVKYYLDVVSILKIILLAIWI
ncbi:LOW QUALITY PROTEIN: hypothetical protein PanWU01x14_043660 [Parasponia andersonii]|uniref:Uncharacterized protein n=1 Tax=Parasponia andersonii TaxID=3476 RepID=A0A2P5DQ64_PARAD|nr:LOW QUALITY PROTEIN: hypothetical protein PanWU01x14_043660 [Parasponia andersonii]